MNKKSIKFFTSKYRFNDTLSGNINKKGMEIYGSWLIRNKLNPRLFEETFSIYEILDNLYHVKKTFKLFRTLYMGLKRNDLFCTLYCFLT